MPYLGIFGGVVWNDRDVTGTMGPAAGVKLFVSDQTFVNIGYRYEWFFNSFEAARDNRTHGNHVVNIGLGFVWAGAVGKRPTKLYRAAASAFARHGRVWLGLDNVPKGES